MALRGKNTRRISRGSWALLEGCERILGALGRILILLDFLVKGTG